jgi:hypothetical protein
MPQPAQSAEQRVRDGFDRQGPDGERHVATALVTIIRATPKAK